MKEGRSPTKSERYPKPRDRLLTDYGSHSHGENGARLGEVDSRYGRIHLVEFLAAAQELGVDRADLVERVA